MLKSPEKKTLLGWRTCAIIEDLETEIEIANNPVTKFKVNWSNTLQGLLDTYQDEVDDPECREVLKEWKDELDSMRYFIYLSELVTLDYLLNTHCAFIYFIEKSCPVRPYSIVVNSTMTALCVYLFMEKYPALCAYSILCDY